MTSIRGLTESVPTAAFARRLMAGRMLAPLNVAPLKKGLGRTLPSCTCWALAHLRRNCRSSSESERPCLADRSLSIRQRNIPRLRSLRPYSVSSRNHCGRFNLYPIETSIKRFFSYSNHIVVFLTPDMSKCTQSPYKPKVIEAFHGNTALTSPSVLIAYMDSNSLIDMNWLVHY